MGAYLTCLIPSLDGCRDRVQNDGEIQHLRVSPSVSVFFDEDAAILVIQLGDVVDAHRILCHQRSLLKHGDHVDQVGRPGEFLHILQQSILGNTNQGVLDPTKIRQARSDIPGRPTPLTLPSRYFVAGPHFGGGERPHPRALRWHRHTFPQCHP